jgi:hypothetical protein
VGGLVGGGGRGEWGGRVKGKGMREMGVIRHEERWKA